MLYLAECGYEYESKGVHKICRSLAEAEDALRNLVSTRSYLGRETEEEYAIRRNFTIVAMEINDDKTYGYWWGEWKDGKLVFDKAP